MMKSLSQQENHIIADMKIDQFISDIYIPHVKLNRSSYKIDEGICKNHIIHKFKNSNISEITSSDVESWFISLKDSGLSPATCNRILAVIKNIFILASTHGLLRDGQSPCSTLRLHKKFQRERYLSEDEAHRLLHELEISPRAESKAIKLLLLTGARKREILKARWEDIDFHKRRLSVPTSYSAQPRHIALSDEAIAIIRSIPRQEDIPWLFPGLLPDKPLSDVFGFWKKLRTKLNLEDVRINDLRHSYARFLVSTGRSLEEVQILLGHSQSWLTSRYQDGDLI